MDTIGLLAAWVSVISFLAAVLAGIASYIASPILSRWWSRTSRSRAERRLRELSKCAEFDAVGPGNGYVAVLVSLYGSMILNLVAAIGLLVVSIEILDLGPAMLAATLPFNINTKLLTRATGVLTLVIGYYFLFRLSYLSIQLGRATTLVKYRNSKAIDREISNLKLWLSK